MWTAGDGCQGTQPRLAALHPCRPCPVRDGLDGRRRALDVRLEAGPRVPLWLASAWLDGATLVSFHPVDTDGGRVPVELPDGTTVVLLFGKTPSHRVSIDA